MTTREPSTCSCGSSQRALVYAAKLAERGDQIAVLRGVPFLECEGCGERLVPDEIAEQLDVQLMRLLDSGAEIAVGRWLGS